MARGTGPSGKKHATPRAGTATGVTPLAPDPGDGAHGRSSPQARRPIRRLMSDGSGDNRRQPTPTSSGNKARRLPRRRQHLIAEDGCCERCDIWLDEDTPLCVFDNVGCQAGASGNAPGYVGFALTPLEQTLGYSTMDKLWFAGNTPRALLSARMKTWYERCLAEWADPPPYAVTVTLLDRETGQPIAPARRSVHQTEAEARNGVSLFQVLEVRKDPDYPYRIEIVKQGQVIYAWQGYAAELPPRTWAVTVCVLEQLDRMLEEQRR